MTLAATPVMDGLMTRCPNATLLTHGRDVGLPEGQMGNSEVGHTNIGAGRVVKMDLVEINDSIEAGEFAERPALVAFAQALKASGGTAHLMGVVSDGGVHGHLNHMIAAACALDDAGVPVVIHALTDGRDVAPRSALGFLETLEAALPDDLYGARRGTTDSEMIFLTMLANGLDTDPQAAIDATLAAIGKAGQGAVKLTCVFSDGDALFGYRFGSDGVAPTLYSSGVLDNGGRAMASEPLCGVAENWTMVPVNRLCRLDDMPLRNAA